MTDQTEKKQCSNTTFTCHTHGEHQSVQKAPTISSSFEAEIKWLPNNPYNLHEETTEGGKECFFWRCNTTVKISGLTPGYSSQTSTSGLQGIHGLQLLISLTPGTTEGNAAEAIKSQDPNQAHYQHFIVLKALWRKPYAAITEELNREQEWAGPVVSIPVHGKTLKMWSWKSENNHCNSQSKDTPRAFLYVPARSPHSQPVPQPAIGRTVLSIIAHNYHIHHCLASTASWVHLTHGKGMWHSYICPAQT